MTLKIVMMTQFIIKHKVKLLQVKVGLYVYWITKQ